MPSIITQTQDMEPDQQFHSWVDNQTQDMEPEQPFESAVFDYAVDTEEEGEDTSMQELDIQQKMDIQPLEAWEPVENGTNKKKLVQITLHGARVRLLPTKVKVRRHLRQKKEKPNKKWTPTLTPKKKRTSQVKSARPGGPVNDPDLKETVKLLQQLKFENSMELRERFFLK